MLNNNNFFKNKLLLTVIILLLTVYIWYFDLMDEIKQNKFIPDFLLDLLDLWIEFVDNILFLFYSAYYSLYILFEIIFDFLQENIKDYFEELKFTLSNLIYNIKEALEYLWDMIINVCYQPKFWWIYLQELYEFLKNFLYDLLWQLWFSISYLFNLIWDELIEWYNSPDVQCAVDVLYEFYTTTEIMIYNLFYSLWEFFDWLLYEIFGIFRLNYIIWRNNFLYVINLIKELFYMLISISNFTLNINLLSLFLLLLTSYSLIISKNTINFFKISILLLVISALILIYTKNLFFLYILILIELNTIFFFIFFFNTFNFNKKKKVYTAILVVFSIFINYEVFEYFNLSYNNYAKISLYNLDTIFNNVQYSIIVLYLISISLLLLKYLLFKKFKFTNLFNIYSFKSYFINKNNENLFFSNNSFIKKWFNKWS